MRSATYNEFGKPSEVLSITDSPTPEPKNNEVRIKTILSSIHNHDIVTIKGEYGHKPVLPATGGSEAVGTIDALGKDVKDFEQGQRVWRIRHLGGIFCCSGKKPYPYSRCHR